MTRNHSLGKANASTNMDLLVSEESIHEFKHDNALFFYQGKHLTIIELNDWDAIKTYIGGNKLNLTIKCAVISLAISSGYNTFYIDKVISASKTTQGSTQEPIQSAEVKKDIIDKYRKISSGTHGVVYHLTFFNVVLKYYTHNDIMFMELSIYELIQSAYENPEEMGLPILLGHGSNYILIPYYPRTLKHREKDEIYNNLGKSIYNLHVLGVVHRDIKFSNVMVKDETVPILLDFGLSTWKVATSHRPPGTSIQTMWFRAPEVANDRKRKFPTDYPSDWWSYGIILVSKETMLITSMTNKELLHDLNMLFSNGKEIPQLEKKYEKCQGFLHKNPDKRLSGSEYFNIPSITTEMMLQYIPVADKIFDVLLTPSSYLPLHASSWTEYFTAIDFLYYLPEEEALDLAHIVIGGSVGKDNFDASYYFSKLEGNILRLNTFSILAMKYPLEKIVFHCFVLSLEGVHFSHQAQAKWIEKNFLIDSATTSCEEVVVEEVEEVEDLESLEIKKHYFNLVSFAKTFDVKRLGYVEEDIE